MTTHSTAARNAAANAVVDLLDVGAGANGTLVFLTAADAVVATLPLAPKAMGAFGSATGGVATANSITPDTNAIGGVITKGQLRDAAGNMVVSFTVAVSGGDLQGNNTTVGAGDAVSVSALTYAAPV